MDEQEIGITINAADQNATITVTGYPAYLRRLEKLAEEFPEQYRLLQEYRDGAGEVYGRRYAVPKKLIRFGKPASEARRAAGRRLAAGLPQACQYAHQQITMQTGESE